MSANLYVYDDTIYEGELSDIETLLAIQSGYGYVPNIIKAKVVRVTPDAVASVKELHQTIQTKIEEVKNLQTSMLDLVDRKLLPQ